MRRLVLMAMCGLVSLSACRPAAPAASTPEIAVVRMAWSDVGVPTPFRVSTAGPGSAVLLSLIYDTLTWKDERGVIPWRATAWDISSDGREVIFTLSHDVRWQDGRALTADDVAFSFDLSGCKSRLGRLRTLSGMMFGNARVPASSPRPDPGDPARSRGPGH